MEPSNNAHQFFIVASSKNKSSEKGYMVHLDFNEYHQKVCTGHAYADSEASDYEKFRPHTY